MALDRLLASVQPFINNLSQKGLLNPDDAADETREIMLKVVLGLERDKEANLGCMLGMLL